MSKDNYSSIFPHQMETNVYIFRITCGFENQRMQKQYPPFGAKICQDICPRTLSACFKKCTVYRERSSRKTVSFEEQIMSKEKYPSVFSPQMEVDVFITLKIFFAMCTVLKIGEFSRIFPSFSRSRDAFRPIARERKYLMDYDTRIFLSATVSGPFSTLLRAYGFVKHSNCYRSSVSQ